jgi:hypothetical protein
MIGGDAGVGESESHESRPERLGDKVDHATTSATNATEDSSLLSQLVVCGCALAAVVTVRQMRRRAPIRQDTTVAPEVR